MSLWHDAIHTNLMRPLGSFPDPGVGLGTSLTRGTANVVEWKFGNGSGCRMEF